ncbi:ATP-dependent DNA helicase [Trichonephila clavipes]|nr:ATP-dependent DNA helicase [Trichonephila clavipes]
MRVQLQNDRSAEIFSHQLLDIGNRKVPADLTSGKISLTHNFCNLVASKGELVETVFPDIQTSFKYPNWLSEHAILAAKNKDVYQLNNIIQSRIQNETFTYKSVDTIVEVDEAV